MMFILTARQSIKSSCNASSLHTSILMRNRSIPLWQTVLLARWCCINVAANRYKKRMPPFAADIAIRDTHSHKLDKLLCGLIVSWTSSWKVQKKNLPQCHGHNCSIGESKHSPRRNAPRNLFWERRFLAPKRPNTMREEWPETIDSIMVSLKNRLYG